MFIKVTSNDNTKMLLKVERIISVKDRTGEGCTIDYESWGKTRYAVYESVADIIGMIKEQS